MNATRIVLTITFLLNYSDIFAQLSIHLLDNFNRADNTIVGSTPTTPTVLTWNEIESLSPSAVSISSNTLVLGSTTAGRDFCYVDMSTVNGYPTNLSSAIGIVTWAFNMRSSRPSPSGFNSTNYGIALILGKTTNDVSTGDGYAVVIGNSGTPDPIRLVRFTDGPDLNSNFTDIISGTDVSTDYLSIRVTFNPSGDLWSLYVENNSSAFPQTNPINTNTQVGFATADNTYTGSSLNYIGPFWNHATSASDNATFDDIYVTDPSDQLPVEISSFSAVVLENTVKLNWRTETEVNNYGFEILRAHTSTPLSVTDWEVLGFVEGNGNSNSHKEYSFVDDNVVGGKYSYRLKQIDTDGKFEYSKVIEVDFGSPGKFKLSQNYPNPFNPATTIGFSLPQSGNVNLTVYNAIGEQVAELVNEFLEAGSHTINFDASELKSGVYFYRFKTETFSELKKMILLK